MIFFTKKKIIFKSLIILTISLFFLTGCTPKLDYIVIEADQEIPEDICLEQKLDTQILIFTSSYCKECINTVAVARNISDRFRIGIFEIDNSDTKARTEFQAGSKISVRYLPTIIAGCKAYVGEKNLEEMEIIFQEYKDRKVSKK